MKLIDDWKKCHRLYSQRINAVGVALCATYGAMYDSVRDVLPPKYLALLTALIFLAGFGLRLVKQDSEEGDAENAA
ncbi:hypothetical protein PQH03_07030 [Ralstonia insidiosa]|uniref:DUF7940 domain-containing protein n=1 Tax=Ralstonia insidiosa TaxID=190721 RepID=UPI00206BE118|nr:hypothetical protein [Ralstonia insidiosa]MDE4924379.1 hypothetical protein [Ralstonia insidiosa]UNJ99923.1 hypothetical protein MMB19_14475 [Ralstonia insidiosa]